jgi:hypothetical protein
MARVRVRVKVRVSRLVKIDEKYGKPQKNCNRSILEIFQS